MKKPTPQLGGGQEALDTVEESSHDSFVSEKHQNWLINNAGLGAYVHGRIHQASEHEIYVGDIIHKRGPLATDDLLKMEEQALLSASATLSTNSRLGRLTALEVLPSMQTANGEGTLIGYYENGVVSYSTNLSPRQTLADGDGKIIAEGWDKKPLVNQILNTVSAVGRYAVAVLPRDHFFRSMFGLHLLRNTSGDGVFSDEATTTISQDVSPILEADSPKNLWGAANGHWLRGHRLFASTGLTYSQNHSSSPVGKGFVVINQASSYTEDRTPRSLAEGLWTFDSGIVGMHKFQSLAIPMNPQYGFLCSSQDQHVYFAAIESDRKKDRRDGKDLLIEGDMVTGRYIPAGLDKTTIIDDGRIEGIFSPGTRVRISIRSDRELAWKQWREIIPCDPCDVSDVLHKSPLGKPPAGYREATWFQFRVENLGFLEIKAFAVDFSEGISKSGKSYCVAQTPEKPDYFRLNDSPSSSRWPE